MENSGKGVDNLLFIHDWKVAYVQAAQKKLFSSIIPHLFIINISALKLTLKLKKKTFAPNVLFFLCHQLENINTSLTFLSQLGVSLDGVTAKGRGFIFEIKKKI